MKGRDRMAHFENDSEVIPDGSSTEYDTNGKGEKKAGEERRTFLFLLVKNNHPKELFNLFRSSVDRGRRPKTIDKFFLSSHPAVR